jgi:drug/metabolite transporter (DMT)-like permease
MGTIMLLPFYLWEINKYPPVKWNGTIIFSVCYLGIGASLICFPIWNIAIRKIGAARTVLFGNLILVFSSFEAVIFLNEEFTWVHIVSAALVFAGIIISNIRVNG